MSAVDPGGARDPERFERTGAASDWLQAVRSVLFAAWMFALAIVLGLACLPLLLAPRRTAVTPIRLWARGALGALPLLVGLRVEIVDRDRAPVGAALVAAKHQGMLDILVALVLLPDPCIVMKKELMWIPIFGWFCAKAGMIPIDRSAGAKAVRTMTRAAKTAAAEGRQLLVFPEGTRRAPGAPPDYRPGVAALYRELALPCTPIATDSGRVWPASGLMKHRGVATYQVLAPIPPGLTRVAFMAALQEVIETASNAPRG